MERLLLLTFAYIVYQMLRNPEIREMLERPACQM